MGRPNPPIIRHQRALGKVFLPEMREKAGEAIGQGRTAKGQFGKAGTGLEKPGFRHQSYVEYYLKKKYGAQNVFSEVTVSPLERFDGNIRIDYVVKDPATNELLYFDAKPKDRGVTFKQQRGFELIETYGAEVRTQKFGDALPYGRQLPPGEVIKIRSTRPEILRLKEEARAVEAAGIVEARNNLQTADVTRLQSTSGAEMMRLRDEARGTSARLTGSAPEGVGTEGRLATREALARGTASMPGKLSREAAAALTKRRALRSVSRFIMSRLLLSIRSILPILGILDTVLLSLQIIEEINTYYREKAIEEALLRGLEKEIPDAIKNGLAVHQTAIARYYSYELERGGSASGFLYLSPRVQIYNAGANGNYKFKSALEVKDLKADLVSTHFVEFHRQDMEIPPDFYDIKLRWSVSQPLFTPFDAFLVQIELIGELLIENWLFQYKNETLLQSTVSTASEAYYFVFQVLSHITATLKYEPYFGFDEGKFDPKRAALDRWQNLQRLTVLIRDRLVPMLVNLAHNKLFNDEILDFGKVSDPLTEQMKKFQPDASVLSSLEHIAHNMNYVDAKFLEYERFKTTEVKQKKPTEVMLVLFSNSIDRQAQRDLNGWLSEVEDFLPNSLKPKRRDPGQLGDYDISQGAIMLGED